mgnify:CR=1 FL=1
MSVRVVSEMPRYTADHSFGKALLVFEWSKTCEFILPDNRLEIFRFTARGVRVEIVL